MSRFLSLLIRFFNDYFFLSNIFQGNDSYYKETFLLKTESKFEFIQLTK